jgi:hypothetical protein
MFMHITLPMDYLLVFLVEISGNYMHRLFKDFEDGEIFWANSGG